jgi:hypothetical protein
MNAGSISLGTDALEQRAEVPVDVGLPHAEG